MSTTAVKRDSKRPRGGPVSELLHTVETDPAHHLAGPFVPSGHTTPNGATSRSPTRQFPRPKLGLWNDIVTMQWMTVPASSFKMIVIVLVLWGNWELLAPYVAPSLRNPFAPFIFLSYYLPDSAPDPPRYAKGPLDILFILYYVIVWSFVRQFLTIHVLHPIALKFGLRKRAKLDRFGEQGYALIYFSLFGSLGIYVMTQLPTWWYRTEHFWLEYPHWRMTPLMKRYYLMQLAYWCQQLIVLVLKLEKPRKDFTELVVHHLVTIWLVGWSYAINLTYIGNAVFLTMDVSDVFLANAKLLNYIKYEKTSVVALVVFMGVWTYLRHYLNIMILKSVWTEFDLIPAHAKRFVPSEGVWMVWWLKYQMIVPILLLQMVNIFWYFLIWRVIWRAVFHSVVADERSDDEDDEDDGDDNGDKDSKKRK